MNELVRAGWVRGGEGRGGEGRGGGRRELKFWESSLISG